MITITLAVIHVIAYLVAVLAYLAKIDKKQKNAFSDNRIDLSWIRLFIFFGIVAFLSVFCGIFLLSFFGIHLTFIYRALPIIIAFGLIGLSFRAMGQSNIEPNITQQIGSVPSAPPVITANDCQKVVDEINRMMKCEKPYLDPELSLIKFAELLGVTRNLLSYTINARYEQNFYDFINGYRIEEAKRLMNDSDANKKNLLDIGMAAGFNSKTAFNVNFKKFTGLTPTQYLKKIKCEYSHVS
jgi:AraC-like DNA-binding protein